MEFFIVDIQAERNGPPTPHLRAVAPPYLPSAAQRCVARTLRLNHCAPSSRHLKGFYRLPKGLRPCDFFGSFRFPRSVFLTLSLRH